MNDRTKVNKLSNNFCYVYSHYFNSFKISFWHCIERESNVIHVLNLQMIVFIDTECIYCLYNNIKIDLALNRFSFYSSSYDERKISYLLSNSKPVFVNHILPWHRVQNWIKKKRKFLLFFHRYSRHKRINIKIKKLYMTCM